MGVDLASRLRFLFVVLAFHSALAFESRCVSDFESNPDQFDICLTKECFIFRSEKPYIFLDDDLNSTNNQVPFRCAEHKQKWPGLDGVFFEMVENMPELNDSYCVYAGRDCTFNGMVSFINNSAVTSSHTWIAGGVLFVLQNRILPGVVPSTSILEDALHVVGPPRENEETFENAAGLVLKPFSLEAWLVFLGVLGFFGLVRVLLIYLFGNTSGWTGFFRYLFLFDFKGDVNPREERESDWFRILHRHWGVAMVVFSSIMLLLYEVALAVIAFESIGLRPFVTLRPEQCAVYENTTEEYMFQLMVGSTTRHTKFNSLDAVYSALADNKNDLRFTVSYGIDNRYKFTAEPELCETLQLYDSVPPTLVKESRPPPITGVWFYSARISLERRMEIDKAILKLKELGRVMEFVNVAVGGREVGSQCKPGRRQIGWFILFMLVGIPIIYLIFISLAMGVALFGKEEPTLPVTDPAQSSISTSPVLKEATFPRMHRPRPRLLSPPLLLQRLSHRLKPGIIL